MVNLSRGHAQAVVDVGISYAADIERAMALMVDVARGLREDPAFESRIVGDFELAGVERWADSAIVLRGRFKVAPLEPWAVRREHLRRLKRGFNEGGIEIPFPQLTVHLPDRAVPAGSAGA